MNDESCTQPEQLTQASLDEVLRTNDIEDDINCWGLLKIRKTNELLCRLINESYTIGRSQNCDICISDLYVSGFHCTIRKDYSETRMRIFLVDSSSNGTYVNDSAKRLTKGDAIELKTGDEIYLKNPKLYPRSDETTFVFVDMRDRFAQLRSTISNFSSNTTCRSPRERYIENYYVICDSIGSGTCGEVHCCVRKSDRKHFAVKIIDTKKFALIPGMSVADLRQEAELLTGLNHPHIIKVEDTFESGSVLYIVMELVKGGDLFDRIVEKGCYSEEMARITMKNILSAVQYLHSNNIIHRDLKPENILLIDSKSDVDIKITDFGFAKKATQEGLKTFCGTPQYFAPEVLRRKTSTTGKGRYGTKVDMWSLGVILYILLSGSFPFEEESLFEQIQQGSYSLAGPEWSRISENAKNLVRMLMTTHPERRINVTQALHHPWITGVVESPQNSSLSNSLSLSNSSNTSNNKNANRTNNKTTDNSKGKGVPSLVWDNHSNEPTSTTKVYPATTSSACKTSAPSSTGANSQQKAQDKSIAGFFQSHQASSTTKSSAPKMNHPQQPPLALPLPPQQLQSTNAQRSNEKQQSNIKQQLQQQQQKQGKQQGLKYPSIYENCKETLPRTQLTDILSGDESVDGKKPSDRNSDNKSDNKEKGVEVIVIDSNHSKSRNSDNIESNGNLTSHESNGRASNSTCVNTATYVTPLRRQISECDGSQSSMGYFWSKDKYRVGKTKSVMIQEFIEKSRLGFAEESPENEFVAPDVPVAAIHNDVKSQSALLSSSNRQESASKVASRSLSNVAPLPGSPQAAPQSSISLAMIETHALPPLPPPSSLSTAVSVSLFSRVTGQSKPTNISTNISNNMNSSPIQNTSTASRSTTKRGRSVVPSPLDIASVPSNNNKSTNRGVKRQVSAVDYDEHQVTDDIVGTNPTTSSINTKIQKVEEGSVKSSAQVKDNQREIKRADDRFRSNDFSDDEIIESWSPKKALSTAASAVLSDSGNDDALIDLSSPASPTKREKDTRKQSAPIKNFQSRALRKPVSSMTNALQTINLKKKTTS